MNRFKLFTGLPVRLIGEVAIFQLLSYVFPLLSLPILSRMLGIVEFGNLFWHISAVGLIGVLSNYAFDWSGTRELVRHAELEDQLRALAPILWSKFALALVGIAVLLSVNFIGFLPQLELHLAALLMLEIALSSWVPNIYFLARRETSKTVQFQLFGRSVVLLGLGAGLLFEVKLTSIDYALLLVLSQAVLLVLSHGMLPKSVFRIAVAPNAVVSALRDGFPMFATFALTHAYTTSNVLFVGYLAGESEAGRFAAAAKLMGTVTQLLVGSTSLVLFPGAVRAASSNEGQAVLRTNLRFVVAGGLVIAGLFALFGGQMVSLVFGSEFFLSQWAATVLGFLALFVGISNAYGTQGLIAAGKESVVGLIIAAGATVAVLGHVILDSRYGAEGGIAAWIAAEALVAVLSVWAYFRFRSL